jgi:catalase
MINRSKTAYEPNSIGGGCPMQAGARAGGFVSFPERLAGPKVRARSEKFFDHFSQAALFYNSQSEPEQDHIVEALRFELGKVERVAIRERMVGLLGQVDKTLAARVAEGLGITSTPKLERPLNRSIGADADVKDRESQPLQGRVGKSTALSMADTVKDTIATRKVAILAADGVDDAAVVLIKNALANAGAQGKIVAPRLGFLKGSGGNELLIEFSFLTASSVLFDAVIVPGGEKSTNALAHERDAIEFITDAYRHCKTIAAIGTGGDLLRACPGLESLSNDKNNGKAKAGLEGVVVGADTKAQAVVEALIELLAKHRHWTRKAKNRSALGRDKDDTRGRAVPYG